MMRTLGPAFNTEESEALIKACRSQVNVKFRHQGRSPATGFDCSGLLVWALKSIGKEVYDIEGYGREPHKDGLRRAMIQNFGQPVDRESMQSGDVVLMSFTGEPRHVGLLADHPQGGLMLVHTHARVRKVTEHRLDDYWRGCIDEVFRP